MRGKDFIYVVIGLIVLYAFGKMVYDEITGNDPESIAKREEQIKLEERDRQELKKEDAIRTFALKESPVLWTTIQDLTAKIIEQNGRIDKLKKTFDDLGMDAERDSDFCELKLDRDRMIKQLQSVKDELEQAYLASVKYEVSRGKNERTDFDQKVSNDGIGEALGSRKRFETLKKEK